MDFLQGTLDALYPLLQPGFRVFRWYILGLGIVAAILYLMLRTRPAPFLRGLIAAALLAGTLLSVVNYNSTQWRNGYYINAYEFFHYYLGAKYAKELGYTHIYAASALAQQEMNTPNRPTHIRDLRLEHSRPVSMVLAENPDLKDRFSEARWAAFKEDTAFFRGRFKSGKLWQRMHSDKGYNAGPVWTMVGGLLTNLAPTSEVIRIQLIALLDPALLLLTLLVVAWVYNPVAAMLMAMLLGAHYVGTAPSLHAAFLRYDWLAALILAACCLKRRWFVGAGILVGYAACVRVFPLIFAFGLGAIGIWTLLAERKVDRGVLRFMIALGMTGLVLSSAAIIYTGGFGYTREFITKITGHNDDLGTWRVGFKYLFLMKHGGAPFWDVPYTQVIEKHLALYRGIQIGSLLVALLAAWRKPPDEALMLGMVPIFFLVAPTYYYYVMLLLPMLYFAAEPHRSLRMVGVILLFASGIAMHWMLPEFGRTFPLFWRLSAMVAAIVGYMVFVAFIDDFTNAFIKRRANYGTRTAKPTEETAHVPETV